MSVASMCVGADAAARHPPNYFSRDCGVVPLSCAPNCASAIQRALTACSVAGGGTVTLATGTYHANDTSWTPNRQPMIILKNLRNVALAGNPGSRIYDSPNPDPSATTLLLYGLHGAFSLANCSNVKISGIQVDMVRQPYTYGQCVSVDESSFTVRFDPERYAFNTPIPDYLQKVQSVMGFDPINWRMARGAVDIYATADPYNITVFGTGSGRPNMLRVHGAGSGARIKFVPLPFYFVAPLPCMRGIMILLWFCAELEIGTCCGTKCTALAE